MKINQFSEAISRFHAVAIAFLTLLCRIRQAELLSTKAILWGLKSSVQYLSSITRFKYFCHMWEHVANYAARNAKSLPLIFSALARFNRYRKS